jgi:hypothetical protein
MKKAGCIFTLCVALLLMSAINVPAAPKQKPLALSGTYYLQGTGTCVQTPYVPGYVTPWTGFDNTFALLQPATTRTRHYEGTLVLNTDGTGTATLQRVTIVHQRLNDGTYPNPYPIYIGLYECLVSYETLPDGTSTMTFEDCTGQYLVPATGLLKDAGSPSFALKVMVSGDMLFLSGTNPSYPPEVSWEGIGPSYVEAERECFRTWTAIKIR